MKPHLIAGTYRVALVNRETGEVSKLPPVAEYKPRADSPADERVYRLADVDLSFTIELSREDGERLMWIIMQAWYWQRYRISYN